MTSECPTCGETFVNKAEVDEHVYMVHAEKWAGRGQLSDSGDEQAEGAVSAKTADTIHTRGGVDRPSAEERAEAMQQGGGS